VAGVKEQKGGKKALGFKANDGAFENQATFAR